MAQHGGGSHNEVRRGLCSGTYIGRFDTMPDGYQITITRTNGGYQIEQVFRTLRQTAYGTCRETGRFTAEIYVNFSHNSTQGTIQSDRFGRAEMAGNIVNFENGGSVNFHLRR